MEKNNKRSFTGYFKLLILVSLVVSLAITSSCSNRRGNTSGDDSQFESNSSDNISSSLDSSEQSFSDSQSGSGSESGIESGDSSGDSSRNSSEDGSSYAESISNSSSVISNPISLIPTPTRPAGATATPAPTQIANDLKAKAVYSAQIISNGRQRTISSANVNLKAITTGTNINTKYGSAVLTSFSIEGDLGQDVLAVLDIYELKDVKGFIFQGRIVNNGNNIIEPRYFNFLPQIDSSNISFSPVTSFSNYSINSTGDEYSVRAYLEAPGGRVHNLKDLNRNVRYHEAIYLSGNNSGVLIGPAGSGIARAPLHYAFSRSSSTTSGKLNFTIQNIFGGETIGKGKEIKTEELIFLFQSESNAYKLWNEKTSFKEKSRTDYMPKFSWDTVPVYAHFARQDGPFTEDEAKFIARYPMMILDSVQEFRLNKGAYWTLAKAARDIKKHNPDIKIVTYWNTWMQRFQVEGEDEFMDNLADWRIYDVQGNPYNHGNRITYDLTKPVVQEWWKQRIRNILREPAIDMVFLDQGALSSNPHMGVIFGTAKANQMVNSTKNLFDWIGQNTNRPIIYNGINYFEYGFNNPDLVETFLNHSDGALFEHFNQYSARNSNGSLKVNGMVKGLERISALSKTGALIPVYASPREHKLKYADGDQSITKAEIESYLYGDFEYNLAKFLIAAGENTYFAYGWSYGVLDAAKGGNFIWYPEYDKRLGPPKGDYVKNGNIFTREFEYASVYLDLNKDEGKITWR